MNIGDKMFAYIGVNNELTLDMVNQYKNSLIFIGDEKQIFVPIVNSYVGIGQTSYNSLLNAISSNGNLVNALDEHIHQNVVNSIFAQYSPDELDIDPTTGQSGYFADASHVKMVGDPDIIGNQHEIRFNNYDYALKANQNTVLVGYTNPNSSGIQVNIKHNGQYRSGTDENGFEYSYYEGYDYLYIDDKNTWSYITTANSYLMNFAQAFAVQQANRVYKNLLGVAEGVYIEKEFNEAFIYNIEDDQLHYINNNVPVYVKTGTPQTDPLGNFVSVKIANATDNSGIYIIYIQNELTNNGKILYTNLQSGSLSSIEFEDTAGNTIQGSSIVGIDTDLLHEWGGYELDANNDKVPVWYHYDGSNTAYINTKISDGINTIKEVAYILDKITDGDNDGINLAYNISYNYVEIEKLKAWKDNIGSSAVRSFQSESKSDLLTVTYYSSDLWASQEKATGEVKLDIDLVLAKTYLDGSSNLHAAYVNPAQSVTYWTVNNDPTTEDVYILLDAVNVGTTSAPGQLSQDIWEYFGGNITQTLNIYSSNNGNGAAGNISSASSLADLVNQLNNYSNKYIYWPFTKNQYDYTKGLTNVEWVTTYVADGLNELSQRIQGIDVSSDIQSYIHTWLNANDSESIGQYVTYVTETDGIINVHKKRIPLDTILENTEMYTDDMFLHVTPEEAIELIGNNIDVYVWNYNNSNQYEVITNTGIIDSTNEKDYYIKSNLANFIGVSANTQVGEMILNGGSYFIKSTANGSTKYSPIDIHAAYTDGSLFTNDYVTNANTIYYLSGTSISRIKYFDVRSVLNNDGHTTEFFTSYITYLSAATATNSGLADAYDVRRTIESMFAWVDLKTNKLIL